MSRYALDFSMIGDIDTVFPQSLPDQRIASSDDARIIPIYWSPIPKIAAPYVHVSESLRAGVRWQTEEIWMEQSK